MQDHKEGSSLQNQALQTLQERLHEADATLKREQESYKQMQVRGEILCVFSQYRGREGGMPLYYSTSDHPPNFTVHFVKQKPGCLKKLS